jgi:two-component system, NtrC family, response regulator HydG
VPSSANARILVIDDHIEMARLLRDQLGDAGYQVEAAASGGEGIDRLRQICFDLVITDLRMSEVDGFDVLAAAQESAPDLPVIIMTGFGSIDSAIEAIKRGAAHYLTKPLRLDEVLLWVQRVLAERRLRAENRSLRRLAGERAAPGALVGGSARMQELLELVERVARSAAPVLIRGESGTGKELVARAIHMGGGRRDRPFVPVNCTALPGPLLESELFGHVRGAFTGATATRRGLFVEAHGGTLFLDEIGDMDELLQGKVLRVLEDGEVRAVGADGARHVDVRVVAATHQDLEARVRDGRFREDLFYRLNVVPLWVPALRDRPEDVPALAEHFLARSRQRNPYSPVRRLDPEVMSRLVRAPWPGNVRELENLIERLVVIGTKESIEVDDLDVLFARSGDLVPLAAARQNLGPLAAARQDLVPLRQLESSYIDWVIQRCGGNKTRAAEILGVDVSTIHRRRRAT